MRLAWDFNNMGDTAILMLHGFMGNSAEMGELNDHLIAQLRTKRVAGVSHQIVSVDLPGHGDSPAPRELEPYELTETAGSIVETLTQYESSTRMLPAHVVGYSFGGRAALVFALTYPEHVRSLTLISTTAGIADPAEREARVASDNELAETVENGEMTDFVEQWGAMPMWDTLRKQMDPKAWERRQSARARNRPVGIANSLRAAGAGAMEPLWDRLGELSMPTLLLTGARDTKYVALADQMAERLGASRHVSLAGLGHAAPAEDPEAVARQVAYHIVRHG